jgi:ornithine decarboxylase
MCPSLQGRNLEDTTFVYDLGNTVRLYRAWTAAMPRVAPFYAVKCNPQPALLRLLAALGAGFDCASKAELEAVMALGVPQDRIIFAHPCKRPLDLRFAAAAGVRLTTFDCEGELSKVQELWPTAELVLRLRCDDPEVCAVVRLRAGRGAGKASARQVSGGSTTGWQLHACVLAGLVFWTAQKAACI